MTTAERWRKVAHDLLRRADSILLCLRRGDTRLQQPDHVVGPIPGRAVESFSLREAHGDPKLAAVQLTRSQRKFKLTRHHADDLVGLAVEKNLPAQYVDIAIEATSPGLVTEQRHLLTAIVLLLGKGAAHQGRDAEHGKHACCKPRGIDLCRVQRPESS